jgi:hypothetical protein
MSVCLPACLPFCLCLCLCLSVHQSIYLYVTTWEPPVDFYDIRKFYEYLLTIQFCDFNSYHVWWHKCVCVCVCVCVCGMCVCVCVCVVCVCGVCMCVCVVCLCVCVCVCVCVKETFSFGGTVAPQFRQTQNHPRNFYRTPIQTVRLQNWHTSRHNKRSACLPSLPPLATVFIWLRQQPRHVKLQDKQQEGNANCI